MSTPTDFDGIFYSPRSGSDAIFGDLDRFLGIISTRDDYVFLVLGAYVDVMINGYKDLAILISKKAKMLKEEEDWVRLFTLGDEAVEMNNAGKRDEVFDFVSKNALPQSRLAPEGYSCVLFPDSLVEAVFSSRSQFVYFAYEAGNLSLAVKVWIDLLLNNQEDLAAEIKEAILKFWPDLSEGLLDATYSASYDLKERNPDAFAEKAPSLIDMFFGRAYMVILGNE